MFIIPIFVFLMILYICNSNYVLNISSDVKWYVAGVYDGIEFDLNKKVILTYVFNIETKEKNENSRRRC